MISKAPLTELVKALASSVEILRKHKALYARASVIRGLRNWENLSDTTPTFSESLISTMNDIGLPDKRDLEVVREWNGLYPHHP